MTQRDRRPPKTRLNRSRKERMLAMRGVIPQIRRMEVYLAAPGSKAGNYDYALVSEFDTLEDLAAYQAHPMHVAFGQFVGALREPEGRACIDYEVEG